MNRRLFPLALSLALLAGCAPAPEPTPEPTPTPAAAVDFHAFLDAVNEKRRAVIEEGEPLDISPWTPDFAGQNHTFTDGEMEALMTRRNMVDYLPPEKAREDLDVFFTLLRTTYGAYEYFGGDEVFELAQDLGALAVYISGAGPTIMAVVHKDDTEFFDRAEAALAADGPLHHFTVHRLLADNVGAVVS